jgi:hypothetical protein
VEPDWGWLVKRVWWHGAWISVTAAIAILIASGAVSIPGGPTPTPTPVLSDCLVSAECYPKPVNTGIGATGIPPGRPAASTSCTTTPTSGQVLTDCLFADGTTITTTGVGATYRYSDFRAPVFHDGTGTLTYENSNFGLTSGCSTYDAILRGENYTVRFSRFTSHIDEGPRDSGNNILIEENFIGPICSNPGDHADGIQGFHGGTNFVVRHNTIDMRGAEDVTSAIFIADFSESADVRYNLVMAGGYSIRLHDDFTPDHGPWVLIGNRILDGAWGQGPMNNSGTTFTTDTCSDNRLVNIDADYNITAVGAVTGC